jgi:hypothetical protein
MVVLEWDVGEGWLSKSDGEEEGFIPHMKSDRANWFLKPLVISVAGLTLKLRKQQGFSSLCPEV